MTNENKQIFEEAEIVMNSGKHRANQDGDTFDYGIDKDAIDGIKRQLIWSGFGALFIVLFIVFLIIGLLVTLIFWLLPFAFAALVAAVIVIGVVSLVGSVRAFFKK